MALEKQIINLSLQQGIDTKTNPKLVQLKLLELSNALVNNGQIQKSDGYTRLAKSTDINLTSFKSLSNFNDNLLIASNDKLYIYDENSDDLQYKGNFTYAHHDAFILKSNITSLATTPRNITALYNNLMIIIDNDNQGLIVYDMPKNVRVSFYDLKTISSTIRPLAAVATDTGVFIYAVNTTLTTSVIEYFIDYATNTLQNTQTVITSFVWSQISDRSLVAHYYNKNIYLLAKQGASAAAATANIFIRNTLFQTVKVIPNIIATDSSIDSFTKYSFCASISIKNNQYITVANDTVFLFDLANYSLINSYALPGGDPKIAPFYTCVYVPNSNKIVLVRSRWRDDQTGANSCFPYVNILDLNSGTFTQSGETIDPRYDPSMIYNTIISADAFTNGNKAFFCVQYLALPSTSTTISTPAAEYRCYNYVLDEDYNIIDTIINQNGIRQVTTIGGIDYLTPSVSSPDFANNNFGVSFYNKSRIQIENKNIIFTYEILGFHFDDSITAPFFAWQRGLAIYMGVSQLFQFSTSRLVEQGFLDYPQISITLTSGGSLTLNQSYQYAAIYEWINGKGEIFRSSPSIIKSVTPLTGTQTATVVITPPAWFTQKQLPGEAQSQKVKLYRTTANGNVLYLLTTIQQSQFTIANCTYVDTGIPDSTIAQNEIIYTSGGVLEDFPAPSARVVTLHNNRLWAVTAENPLVISYSKPYQISVGVGFSPYLTFPVEPRGGIITELASLDDKLIIFKRDYIYVVAGDGADAVGNNSTLSTPELINSPVGCSEPNSIVRTPLGIMFKSLKGIYLLDRSLSVSYIGADVEKYNSETIISASLSLAQNKVKFITKEGSVLTYDYFYNTWSTEENLPSVSTAIYNANFVTLLDSGKIYLQTPGYYRRESSNYSMRVRTGWLNVGKLQAYQRIYEMVFLGDLKGEHVLRVGISYDYVDSIRDYVFFDPKVSLGIKNAYGIGVYGQIKPFGGDAPSAYQFRLKFPRQKVQAISLTFEDVFDNTSSESGNSFTITDIQFLIGIKQGNYKVNRLQMVG